MALQKYKQKRKFKETPEPQGKVQNSQAKQGAAFVVHEHYASHLHYDLRLEVDGVLKSWAVPKGPSLNPGDKRLAMMVEDHPFEYRRFKGAIPVGNYGAGLVNIFDQGNYTAINPSTEEAAKNKKQINEFMNLGLKKGHVSFVLNGEILKGQFDLVHIKGRGGEENTWLLLKKKDPYAKKSPVLAYDPMPHNIEPMLAKLVDGSFNDPEYIFEIKWDGYRAIAEVDHKKVKLYSRNHNPFEKKYPDIVKELSTLGIKAVFDGEIVVLDKKGVSHFQLLQNYENTKGKLCYYVFDLIYLNDKNLEKEPLIKRKQILQETLKLLPKTKYLRFSDHFEKNGLAFLKAAKKQGLEGIIAKRKSSSYKQGKRTEDWQKIKIIKEQEAIIGGFTEPKGSRNKFGALVLGVYEQGNLVYIGHTGGGFNEKSLKQVYDQLKKLVQKESPFKDKPRTNAPVTWVKPELVVQVKFQEWTESGDMRQPIFLGLRSDKAPKNVHREK